MNLNRSGKMGIDTGRMRSAQSCCAVV